MRIEKIHLSNIGVFTNQIIRFPIKKSKDKAEIHIFTGPNGCGKTTLLYAISSVFSQVSTQTMNGDVTSILVNNLQKRFHTFDRNSFIKVYTNSNKATSLSGNSYNNSITISYQDRLVQQYMSNTRSHQGRFSFGVFGYSGYRNLNANNNQKTNYNLPLMNAIDFNRHLTSSLQYWVKTTLTKSAAALQNGNVEEAQTYTQSISVIENAILDIIGEPIKFKLNHKTLNVEVQKSGVSLDFEVLPAGLKSLISWMADMLSIMDMANWTDNASIFDKNIILLLDEVEVHLHPKWQREILPVIQKLFKNAQIFITTHSPFIVNSVADAYIYKFSIEQNNSQLTDTLTSQTGKSYDYILDEVFGVEEDFDIETEEEFDVFYKMKNAILNKENINETKFINIARKLAEKGLETQNMVMFELRQLNKLTQKNFQL